MADDNPRIYEGANHPPADVADPFAAFEIHITDLFAEAKNFLDGAGVQTEGEAEAVSRLLDMLRKAAKDADAARAAEKKPHDDAAKAVQAKWRPLLDRCDLAVTTAKSALAPYLQRVEEQQRAAAEAARSEAEAKAAEAAAAVSATRASDLAGREAAEALLQDAKRAGAVANKAEASRAHAKGGERATTLRSYYTPVLVDPKAALTHYVRTNPEAINACLLTLAKADVQAGKRQVPGFKVTDERRVV